jgi:hypothetical protein
MSSVTGMVARRRQALTLAVYVVWVIALAGLAVDSFRWHSWVGAFLVACLIRTLVPLGAVWSTWRVNGAKPLGWDCPDPSRAGVATTRVAGTVVGCSPTFRIGPT